MLSRAGEGPAVTDDRGEYRIAQLAPGDYTAGILSTTTTLPESVAAALDPSVANRDTYVATTRELAQSGFFRTWGCPTCISNSHEGHHVAGFVLQRPGVPLPRRQTAGRSGLPTPTIRARRAPLMRPRCRWALASRARILIWCCDSRPRWPSPAC